MAGLSPSSVTFRIGSLDQFSGGETATAVGVASTSDRHVRTAYANVTAYLAWIFSIAGVLSNGNLDAGPPA